MNLLCCFPARRPAQRPAPRPAYIVHLTPQVRPSVPIPVPPVPPSPLPPAQFVLPTELLRLIIQLAAGPLVPSSSPSSTKTRDFVLRRFLFVSRVFSALAHAELLRHVRLSTPAKAREFLALLEGERESESGWMGWEPEEIAEKITSLVIGQRHGVSFEKLPERILCKLPRLAELWVLKLEALDLASINVAASSLVSLHRDEVRCAEDSELLALPNLHSLSLNSYNPRDKVANWTLLPNLSKLALRWQPIVFYVYSNPLIISVDVGLNGHKLTFLVLGQLNDNAGDVVLNHLSFFTSLKHLSTNDPSLLPRIATRLSSPLVSLHIGAHFPRNSRHSDHSAWLHNSLNDPPGSLSKLMYLSLPQVWNYTWGERCKESQRNNVENPGVVEAMSARDETRRICRASEIVLVERKLNEDGEDFPCRWQECVEWADALN